MHERGLTVNETGQAFRQSDQKLAVLFDESTVAVQLGRQAKESRRIACPTHDACANSSPQVASRVLEYVKHTGPEHPAGIRALDGLLNETHSSRRRKRHTCPDQAFAILGEVRELGTRRDFVFSECIVLPAQHPPIAADPEPSVAGGQQRVPVNTRGVRSSGRWAPRNWDETVETKQSAVRADP